MKGIFKGKNLSVSLALDRPGLRHPAYVSRCKQRLRLAGRGPNSNALDPPLAAVVAVAPSRGALGKENSFAGFAFGSLTAAERNSSAVNFMPRQGLPY